jgi:hypothetical protein
MQHAGFTHEGLGNDMGLPDVDQLGVEPLANASKSSR